MPIGADVSLGKNVKIFQPELVNLYGCTIEAETKIGAFVEIQKTLRWVLAAKFHHTPSYARA